MSLSGFVAGRQLNGTQDGNTTPSKSTMDQRRKRAKGFRVKPGDQHNQKPSAQKPMYLDGAQQYEEPLPDHRVLEHGQGDLGVFDRESVAADEFDLTKSSFGDDGGNGQFRGNQSYAIAAQGYETGHHNSGNQEQLQNGHYGYAEDIDPNQAEYDDDSSSLIDGDGETNLGDDQTVTIQGMVHDVRHNPAFQAYQTKSNIRTNGPNHFAELQPLYNKQANYSQHNPIDAFPPAYKAPLSAHHGADQNYKNGDNGLSSPTNLYSRGRNLSTIAQEEDTRLDEVNSEGQGQHQGRTSPFAPSVDDPEELLNAQPPRETGGKRKVVGSNEVVPVEVEADPIQPDYDESTLFRMDYATLRDQPFDDKPAERPKNKSNGMPPPSASLEESLAQLSKATPEQQEEHFSNMSKDDWEKSGDWFIDQFTNVMKQMREARQTKRDIAKGFEDEISARQQAVKGKFEGIEKVLKDMRTGGEGVLKRKM